MNGSPPPNARALVMWTLWVSLTGAIVIYQATLGGGWLSGDDARSALQNPAAWLSAGSLLAAAVVRWLFIPRTNHPQRLLVLMIGGMALSEAVEFYSIFLFPADMPQAKMSLFVLSLCSALQFMPLYLKEDAPQKDR